MPTHPAPESEPTSGGPILVVDDDPTLRQTICWVLQDEGLTVETAADGREALARAMARRPALILLDIGLPIVDGYGVADGIHATYGDVPIIAITADGRAAEKAQRVGARTYLHKPFDVETLLAAVHTTLGRAGEAS